LLAPMGEVQANPWAPSGWLGASMARFMQNGKTLAATVKVCGKPLWLGLYRDCCKDCPMPPPDGAQGQEKTHQKTR